MEYLFEIKEKLVHWITEKPSFDNLNEGKYKVTVKKCRGKVTSNQYRYYYGVIIKYWCKEGYEPVQMDIILKTQYARSKGWINDNGFILVPSKSRDFDTKMQEELNRFARELYFTIYNGFIPLPNETDYDY